MTLLGADDPDPGHWGPEHWEGLRDWSRMHGATQVDYSIGRAVGAAPVSFERRVCEARRLMLGSISAPAEMSPVEAFRHQEAVLRRLELAWRIDHAGRVLRGRLEFNEATARFIPDEAQPTRLIPDDPFETALLEAMGELVKDRAFAVRLYASLCNVEWQSPGQEPYSMTFRTAGGLVADLRGLGEEYVDFYGSGPEGQVDRQIAELLARQGWRPAPL